MSKKITIILLEDIASLGAAGDIVHVTEGYARNFLFSQGKAALATDQAKRTAADRANRATQAEAQANEQLQKLAQVLDTTELTFPVQVKDGDEIFGSINATAIAKQLREQANIKVRAADIGITEPLTKLGSHAITVRLSPDVEARLNVTLVAKESPGGDRTADEA